MQLTFRLIDLLTASILPFLTPDYYPTERDEIEKRITQAYKTNYTVELFGSSIYLRPNYMI